MTLDRPTFTIITVNYNSGAKLTATAHSVLKQTASLQYLIIDGASTDKSLSIARDIEESHSSIVSLVSQPDRGIYDAMNKGIALAKGRYIYFLGAGDTLMDEILRAIESSLPTNDRTFLYGNVLYKGRNYDGRFSRQKLTKRNICHQAIFYGRNIFHLCGHYNLDFRRLADWDFNMRCFGNRRVIKHYLPLTIAMFEEGGVGWEGDPAFDSKQQELIAQHLGKITVFRRNLEDTIHGFKNKFRKLGAKLRRTNA
jgi:glycosyltransferase involved in cell wall biosynthesis